MSGRRRWEWNERNEIREKKGKKVQVKTPLYNIMVQSIVCSLRD
jgi:hypothetical protein